MSSIFHHHPWELMLQSLPEIFRQLSFYGSYYKGGDGKMYFSVYDPPSESWVEQEISDERKMILARLRSKVKSFIWDDGSVYQGGNTPTSLDLEAELNKNVLVLLLPNQADHQSDVLFLHFGKALKHFLPSRDEQVLTTEHKALVGNLVLKQIEQKLSDIKEFQKAFHPIQKSFVRAETEMQVLQENNNELRQQHRDYIRLLCHEWLRREGERYDTTIRLSEGAVKNLMDAGIGLAMMEHVLINAAKTVKTIHPYHESLTIESHHLEWENDTVATPVKQLPRKDKTIELLDKYEAAAIQLLQSGKKVTGKDIAATLRPAVSPPAITDAVKKHKKSIAFLLDRYPNRWNSIRNYLSPIKKIEGELKRVG